MKKKKKNISQGVDSRGLLSKIFFFFFLKNTEKSEQVRKGCDLGPIGHGLWGKAGWGLCMYCTVHTYMYHI